MRSLGAAVLAVTFGLVLTSVAHAAVEDKAHFARRVAKYAASDLSKPKGLCWCKDGFGSFGNSGEAGYVMEHVTQGQVIVSCEIPEYDPPFPTSLVSCAVEWDMLGK
jgi:hypothetical protein